jgi:NADH-quinone oxidoreductase subunit M
MLHAGVLMKLGGYGALRIAVYLLPEGAKDWGLFFMVLTTINILYGSFGAVMQKDLKYFTAYSSVSHCGFVLFGVATLNLMGFKGAVLQMFSHGIMTGLFFGLIGMVYGRTHTRVISDMGGLAKVMPWRASGCRAWRASWRKPTCSSAASSATPGPAPSPPGCSRSSPPFPSW